MTVIDAVSYFNYIFMEILIMPRNKLSRSNNAMKEKQNNLSYQSLYFWTSFLLGMISLGIFVWQRSSESAMTSGAVIPSGPVIPCATRELLPSHFMEIPHDVRDDNFIVTYATPLILSALAYQQTNNAMSGLLFGLNSYINIVRAQDIAPALTVDLSNLRPEQGITFTGSQTTGENVYAIDINKDKKMDLLLGARLAWKAYLVYGPNFNVTNLDNLSGQQGAVFTGSARTGISVYAADVNNDGNIDILVGTYSSNKVYLVYGPTFNMTNLDGLSGQEGIIFTSGQYIGSGLYAADVNKDGYVDILIGAASATLSNSKVYIVYGPTFNTTNLDGLSEQQGLVLTGSGVGSPIITADMNRDGNMDILVGGFEASKTYLIFGPTFNTTNLDNLSGDQGVVFTGSSGTGISVYAADMNRDGNVDILIGAYYTNKAYLVYGPNFNITNLDNLNGTQGIVFANGQYVSYAVYAADMNHDGNIDIMLGAYLVYGPNFTNAANLGALTFREGVVFAGGAQSNYAADMNGDGNLDAIIGVPGSSQVCIVYNHVFNVFPPVTTITPSLKTTTLVTTALQQTTNTLAATSAAVTLSNVATTRGSIVSTATTQTNVSVVGKTILSSGTIVESSSIENTIISSAENTNSTNYIIEAAAGACVAGTILGAVGLFAVNKCRKKKASPNNLVAMKDINENNQASSFGKNSGNTVSSSQYETVTVATNRYSGMGLQHQDRQSSAANAVLAQRNYVEIDETKKTEKQYVNTPTFEL
jgi:hypothetical protein